LRRPKSTVPTFGQCDEELIKASDQDGHVDRPERLARLAPRADAMVGIDELASVAIVLPGMPDR
jgi:hypothetical protein